MAVLWRERVKSALLVVLVGLSIHLSLLLWQGLPPAEAPAAELPAGGTYWGAGRDPVALLAPARLVLYRAKGAPALLYPGSPGYERAWSGALDVLQQLGSLSPAQLAGEEVAAAAWKPGAGGIALELIFPLPIGPELWGPVLDYPEGFQLPWPVQRALVVPGQEPALLLAGPGPGQLRGFKLPGAGTTLGGILRELSGTALLPARELKGPPPVGSGLYVPGTSLSLPVLRVGGEAADPEVVASSFFADLSLTRCIRERDGATIYSDGQRGVRVSPDGGVEYNAPEVMAGVLLPPAQALERAARFITQHGGWPQEARLAQLAEVPSAPDGFHYRLVFTQYWNGLPALTPTLELMLSDRGVGRYRRSVLRAAWRTRWASVSSAGLEEAISRSGKLPKEDTVADVYLAYREETGQSGELLLVPVWAVETAHGRIFWLPAEGGGGQ